MHAEEGIALYDVHVRRLLRRPAFIEGDQVRPVRVTGTHDILMRLDRIKQFKPQMRFIRSERQLTLVGDLDACFRHQSFSYGRLCVATYAH